MFIGLIGIQIHSSTDQSIRDVPVIQNVKLLYRLLKNSFIDHKTAAYHRWIMGFLDIQSGFP